MANIAAVHQLKIPDKFLICLGFGIDTFHGVRHAQVHNNSNTPTFSSEILDSFFFFVHDLVKSFEEQ